MDKKIKFSDQPKKVKIIYASVVSVLCVTAIVLGIVSATGKNSPAPNGDLSVNVPNNDVQNGNQDKEENGGSESDGKEEEKPEDKLTFVSPIVGEITRGHSIDTPVFSDTLKEWRVHTGIDISAEMGDEVYASAKGTVSRVYNDAKLGKTVEITHQGGIVSVYSNLASDKVMVKEGDYVASGAVIGLVGDSSISELADEAHLHFGIKLNGVSVNPLDYISEDSKKVSLGIVEL